MKPEHKLHYIDALAALCELRLNDHLQQLKHPDLVIDRAGSEDFLEFSSEEFRMQPFYLAIKNPLKFSVRLGIRHIGSFLFAEGGIESMTDISDKTADRFPRHWTKVSYYIDRSWDGLGDERGGYWVA